MIVQTTALMNLTCPITINQRPCAETTLLPDLSPPQLTELDLKKPSRFRCVHAAAAEAIELRAQCLTSVDITNNAAL